MRSAHLVARFDTGCTATLDALEPLVYDRAPPEGLPVYVRSASALRRFGDRLVIVQDDVNALAVGSGKGLSPVLLPAHPSGQRVFDDTLGNKHLKLDLEACVTLPDGRFVAFGSGSLPARECLVVWNGRDPPTVTAATAFYAAVRRALQQGEALVNLEGAVMSGGVLQLFHRGNDRRGSRGKPRNAIVTVNGHDLEHWLDRGVEPRVASVTTVDLGEEAGVPYGFTDAVALDAERVVVLACAEDSSSALTDGAVLGCRVGVLDDAGITMVDVHDAHGRRSLLKLEGIERRPGSSHEFDVVVDVDRPGTPALIGRLTCGSL